VRHLKPFVDRRLAGYCIYCFGPPNTRDHVPPRIFLDEPYPDNVPVVPACDRCNQEASLDEQYVACLVEVAASGSTDPGRLRRPKISRTLTRRPALAALITQSVVETQDGLAVTPDHQRVERVFAKIGRGVRTFETGELSGDDVATVTYRPLSELDADAVARFYEIQPPDLLPEVGSRMMQRVLITNEKRVTNEWEVLQPGQFEYAVEYLGSMTRVKFVVGNYLAVEVDLEKAE